jgi:hypothetical protein
VERSWIRFDSPRRVLRARAAIPDVQCSGAADANAEGAWRSGSGRGVSRCCLIGYRSAVTWPAPWGILHASLKHRATCISLSCPYRMQGIVRIVERILSTFSKLIHTVHESPIMRTAGLCTAWYEPKRVRGNSFWEWSDVMISALELDS